MASDINIPFVPSVYCNPDIKEHRRVEVCKDLQDNPEFRSVGICKHAGCKGKKFYKRDEVGTFHGSLESNTLNQAKRVVDFVPHARDFKKGAYSMGREID